MVVITDNAQYNHARLHRDWYEQHADRFALDYLPPYTPELNPIERVWKLTRRLCFVENQFCKLVPWQHHPPAIMRNYSRRHV